MAVSTEHRMFALHTPLGADELLLRDMTGRESLSRLFEFDLKLISDRDDIQPEDVIGKRSTLRVETFDGEQRYFTGFMSRFTRIGATPAPEGMEGEYYAYECDLVPWLWFMLQHEDSRIFQDKTIPEIVEAVFAEFDYSDYELKLSGEHPPLTYCVQYRETNFAFVSRLLERAGIHYFFRHEPQAEKLILTDNRDHNPKLEPDTLPFHDLAMAEASDSITALKRRERLHTGRVVLRDYDFERPSADLEVSVDSLVKIGDSGNYERFVHPDGYTEREHGDALARVRMEAEEADQELLDGASDVRTLVPGHVFTLERHPEDALNEDYLIVSVEHRGRNNLGSGRDSGYDNRFTVIPHRVQYRAPLTTPRARAHGPQTAVVSGPAGEEIHTDKYGRVKVKFRWDRIGKADDTSSCWLRVLLPWAGRQWGAFGIPRIGMEVLVDFLEGDPDQPIVVGCFYNGENMPPYELPANATRTGIKTNSSKGGAGFNELRFEDRKGAEHLFMHAQKDLGITVQNNETHLVVKGNRSVALKTGDESKTIAQGSLRESICKARSTKANTVQVKTEAGKAGAGTQLYDASDQITQRVGDGSVTLLKEKIEIKFGPSTVVVSSRGIFIDGPVVHLNKDKG